MPTNEKPPVEIVWLPLRLGENQAWNERTRITDRRVPALVVPDMTPEEARIAITYEGKLRVPDPIVAGVLGAIRRVPAAVLRLVYEEAKRRMEEEAKRENGTA